MNLTIALLPGDGIGPEVTEEAVKILKAIGRKFDHRFIFKKALIGAEAIFETGLALPLETLEICQAADATLLGAIGHPDFDNDPKAKVRPEQGLLALRKVMNLYCNIRPVRSYDILLNNSPLKAEIIKDVDFLIFRELTGGLYFGEKKISEDGNTASDLCSYSVFEIERIAHQAFKSAKRRKGKLTLIDKANVLETSRLWRKTVNTVAEQYPEVKVECLFVDNAAMQLILNPKQFDVILTENLFGDIISDEASVIGGSIGLLPSASIGDNTALFEPVHGSYPQAKGKGIANPIATILSVAMLLKHFNLNKEAELVEFAAHKAIDANVCTPDLISDSIYSTSMVGDFIESTIEDTRKGILNSINMALGQITII